MLKLGWRVHKFIFVALILLSLLCGALPLTKAWLIKWLFDLLVASFQRGLQPDMMRQLVLVLIGQGVALIFGQMVTPTSNFLSSELGRRLTFTTQKDVYETINRFAGLAHFENPGSYDIFRLAVQGAQFGPLHTLRTLIHLVENFVTLSGFIGILVAYNLGLAALVTLAALPQLYAQLKFGRQRFELALDISPDERRVFYLGHLMSSAQPAKEIRLFGLGDHFLNSMLCTYSNIHRAQRLQEGYELRWKLGLEVFSALVSVGAFMVVVRQAFTGQLSLGDVTLYTSAVSSLQGALSVIVFALSNLNENALFFSHYQQLKEMSQPVKVASVPLSVPSLTSGIELRNVSFRYSENHPWVLRNVNLFIPAGQSLALVGLNGAGKTTLVKLLSRLYDSTEGKILWDGEDIREFDPEELRQHMAVILQDFTRYDFTAHENIALGDVKHIEDTHYIQKAAEKAGIHKAIEGLPRGYQTNLSRMFGANADGVDLSGGEWQKIALARIFMRKADLFILDEPTAALDVQTEHELYSRLRKLSNGNTSLFISHRFSMLNLVDKTAVIEGGQIIEYGTHEELRNLGGTYARLYSMQAENYKF